VNINPIHQQELEETMYATSEEAKAMLEKAIAAVKQDKAKALDMFNKGEGGLKDRDLYVWYANASDGIMTAHPWLENGKWSRDAQLDCAGDHMMPDHMMPDHMMQHQ
jgi:hypothetical protein